jgi:hypothetical protein
MSTADVHARAEAVREHRRLFKETVLSGETGLAQIFDAALVDPVLGETKLLGLVEAIPDIGKVQTRRTFEAVGLAETVRVGAVDADTQAALAAGLGLA